MYSTVPSIVQGILGSTVLKGDFKRKRCVPNNILVDSFIYYLNKLFL